MSQQQSDKHGPAIDDALQDDRGQSSAGTRHESRPQDGPVGGDTTDDLRVEIARFLGPAAFPGDPTRLQAVAADNDTTNEVREVLRRLPAGTYTSVQDVLDAL